MANLPDLSARFRIDTTELDKASAKAQSFGSKVGSKVKVGMAVAGVAAVGFAKASVEAFAEAEQAQARLSDAFDKFPALADTNKAALDKLNSTLAKKTRFDDDATASGQAVLAQFGLTGKQITELTPLLQDYAAKTGKDLPSAAGDLGKALKGQGRALKAIGINFKDTGSTAGNLEQLMGGLRSQVGGFAEKEGKTAAGRAAILKNQFGEVQEQVGEKLMPVLLKLANILLKVIDFLERHRKVVVPLVAVLGTLAAIIYTITLASKIWIAVQTALNLVLTANPIGVVVVAIGLLVAAIVIAYKKSETFRNLVHSLWAIFKRFVGFTPLGALIKNFDKVLSVIKSAIDGAKRLLELLGIIDRNGKKSISESIGTLAGAAGVAGAGAGSGAPVTGERGITQNITYVNTAPSTPVQAAALARQIRLAS